MMSLIALPLVVGATREALQAIPRHVREASYALGKTRAATIRRVLLPASRAGIATGVDARHGPHRRRHRDRRAPARRDAAARAAGRRCPGSATLRGTGSTLTSYVYNNSPAGEGNAPQKAYAAAFVLLLIVLALNFAVDLRRAARSATDVEPETGAADAADRRSRRIRRADRRRRRRSRGPATNGARRGRRTAGACGRRRGAARPAHGAEVRSACASRRLTSPTATTRPSSDVALPVRQGEVLGADRPVGLRQDDAAALAQPAHRADAERAPRGGRILLDGEDVDDARGDRRCGAASRWSSSSRTRSR